MDQLITSITEQDKQPPFIETAVKKIGKTFSNKLQFEEAVQQLLEEYEKHPHPPKGVFY